MKAVQIGEILFLKNPQDVNAAQIFCKTEKVPLVMDQVGKDISNAVEEMNKKAKGKKVIAAAFDLVPKYQACFSLKEGEVVFSDKFESLEPVVNIVESLNMDKVLEDLYLRKSNVHTATLYTKEEKLKVAVNFKFGSPVFAGPFDDSMQATDFIIHKL
jgi:hypothetical protein